MVAVDFLLELSDLSRQELFVTSILFSTTSDVLVEYLLMISHDRLDALLKPQFDLCSSRFDFGNDPVFHVIKFFIRCFVPCFGLVFLLNNVCFDSPLHCLE